MPSATSAAAAPGNETGHREVVAILSLQRLQVDRCMMPAVATLAVDGHGEPAADPLADRAEVRRLAGLAGHACRVAGRRSQSPSCGRLEAYGCGELIEVGCSVDREWHSASGSANLTGEAWHSAGGAHEISTTT